MSYVNRTVYVLEQNSFVTELFNAFIADSFLACFPCKLAPPIFNFGTKLSGRRNESCAALDMQWPTAGLACTCSWETWLKHSKECESVNVRGSVHVNTHSCSQGCYSLQRDAIDTQTSAPTGFVSKLCKVTLNSGAHFIFSRTLRN